MTTERTQFRALRDLLQSQRVASLGTLADDGTPFVSMVPFAVDAQQRCLVIHVSSLAAHTRHLQTHPRVSLMVMHAEEAGEPVHALSRATLLAKATLHEADTPAAQVCRTAYLARFPEAGPMTTLGDFRFVSLVPEGARLVAGFGAARNLDADYVLRALGPGST